MILNKLRKIELQFEIEALTKAIKNTKEADGQ